MSALPQVHALWSHAARQAQLAARRLGWTKRVDRSPEHERVEQVLEVALRAQTRKTVEVLRQELLTVSAFPSDRTLDVQGCLFVRRDAMLACVDDVLADVHVKQPSARRKGTR